jgi:hypothetical protein
MKVNSLCNYFVILTLSVLISWLCAIPVFSAIGGGAGSPRTPYGIGGKPDAKTILRYKEQASTKRNLSKVGTEYFYSMYGGLAYVTNGEIKGDVRYSFWGFDEKGCKIEIDFCDVKDFRIMERDGKFLVLEVTLFPAISPEELLNKQPSYQDLIDNYTKSVKIRILPRDTSGNILQIIGIDYTNRPHIILPVEKLRLGQKVKFEWNVLGDSETFWWAIPSVIEDPAYPYRLKIRK